MQITTSIEKKKYLRSLREQLDSWFAFGQSRFTGIVLGNFLYITSHAGYEWNCKITNQKSRAIGFVTDYGGDCKVSVITTRGYLDPVSMLLWYLLGVGYFLIQGIQSGMVHVAAAAVALLVGVWSFVADWFTERGQENMHELITLLRDPVPVWEDSEV